MRSIEKEADSSGLSYFQMMENAGRGLAEIVHVIGQENGWEAVAGLVGSGNNGGDTLVALSWLAEAGWSTQAYLVNRKTLNDVLITRFLDVGGKIFEVVDDKGYIQLRTMLFAADVLLDGLLGTGIRLPLKPPVAEVLDHTVSIISEMDPLPFVVAVDCPSGVDCDSGEAAWMAGTSCPLLPSA